MRCPLSLGALRGCQNGRSYNSRLQACRQLRGGADVITCISETEDDLEPDEKLIKRNSASRSNLCFRARFVTAKGAELASSRLQECGQLHEGADIVTCIVGNEDCLQGDLELVSRNPASHLSSAVESGLRLPQGRVLQDRDSRPRRRYRGQIGSRARRLNGNIHGTFTRKAVLECRPSTCSAKRRPQDPRDLRDNDSRGLDGREQLQALLWHHRKQEATHEHRMTDVDRSPRGCQMAPSRPRVWRAGRARDENITTFAAGRHGRLQDVDRGRLLLQICSYCVAPFPQTNSVMLAVRGQRLNSTGQGRETARRDHHHPHYETLRLGKPARIRRA